MASILVVEDEPLNREVMCRMLVHHGFKVYEAEHGAAALGLAQQYQPGLVLLDLSMPVLDGWATAQRFKEHPQLWNIPLIAVTAHSVLDAREQALHAGCNDYVTKPIDFVKLLVTIRRWL